MLYPRTPVSQKENRGSGVYAAEKRATQIARNEISQRDSEISQSSSFQTAWYLRISENQNTGDVL
jgi:hypothetical protein